MLDANGVLGASDRMVRRIFLNLSLIVGACAKYLGFFVLMARTNEVNTYVDISCLLRIRTNLSSKWLNAFAKYLGFFVLMATTNDVNKFVNISSLLLYVSEQIFPLSG